ncbi:Uncharacterised protein [BD1-7 clade bacterium]|uniref:PD-(D/E)XK nuclease superfamily protein n=1 Tax=BD1-7 clade bacterium TaxID=2029982 RepID=A0A5S9PJD1_9GAMM|nr:Uncharacterised protein [BD1-7 clade bacterium]
MPDFFAGHTSLFEFDHWHWHEAISFVEYDTGDYGRVDIVVVLPNEGVAIVIENKVGANETKGQLKRYRQWAEKALSDYAVLHVHMDYYEKWQGKADEQWVQLSYDWTSEVLDFGMKSPKTPERVRYLLQDYFIELHGSALSDDNYFKPAQSVLKPFAKKHAKAIKLCEEDALDFIDASEYLAKAQKKWTDEFRIQHWAKKNAYTLNLLTDCGHYDLLEDRMEKAWPGIGIEHKDDYFRVCDNIWRDLINANGRYWVVYLELREFKQQGVKKLGLKLKFCFVDMANEALTITKAIFARYAEQPLNVDNIGKTRSLWLERDLNDDESVIEEALSKHIRIINTVFREASKKRVAEQIA